jgi:hypothetical protein
MWKINKETRLKLFKRNLKRFKEIYYVFRKPIIHGFSIREFFIGRFRNFGVRFKFFIRRI